MVNKFAFIAMLSMTKCVYHYTDVIMITMASQITSLTIVYSTVYSGADQSKHQNSASLAFVWGIHRGPVNSPHKWPVTWKMFPFDDVIMTTGKCMQYLESTMEALVFDILICWKWLGTNQSSIIILMQLSHVVLWTKNPLCNVRN